MSRPPSFALLASLVMLTSVTSGAEVPDPTELPSKLTLDEALRIFRQRGLDLLIADAAVAGARADVKSASVIPNPSLGLGAGHTFLYNPSPADCPGCSATSWSASISDSAAIEDTLAGKRGLRIAVAEAALKAARMNRVDALRNLEFQVKQQYIQAVLARDTLDFALEVQKSSTQTFELNRLRYEKGAISEADEARVETAMLEADQGVSVATQALRNAKVGIAFLLGVRGPVPEFHVEQDLPKYVVPASLDHATPGSLLAEALDHRPDLKGQAFQSERAEKSIASARRLRIPDVALSVALAGEGTGTNALQPPTLSFGVQLPLPLFYQQQGEIAHARADLQTQRLQFAKVEAQVVSDVNTAWSNLSATRELVERMEGRLLDRARRARDLVAIQYQKGGASLLEFLDAQRTYVAINLEYLQDLTNYWTAVFQLEQAVGVELRK